MTFYAENAAHFGGVPKTLVIDNLSAWSTDWFDPVDAECSRSASTTGTVILPTKSYTPRPRKVEVGKYVQNNGLKGASSPAREQQRHLALGTDSRRYADSRHHQATSAQGLRWSGRALALPRERFANFHEAGGR
jgi:hypothetical protein